MQYYIHVNVFRCFVDKVQQCEYLTGECVLNEPHSLIMKSTVCIYLSEL